MVVGFHFVVHQVLDFQGIEVAGNHHPQIIGDELDEMVVGQQFGVTGEQRAALGLFDIVLDGHQALFPGLGEDVVEHGHDRQVALLGVFGALEGGGDGPHGSLQVLAGVGHDERAEGGATDHQQFQGLEQGADVSACHGVAANDGAHHYDVSDDDKHAVFPLTGSRRAGAGRSPSFRTMAGILEAGSRGWQGERPDGRFVAP